MKRTKRYTSKRVNAIGYLIYCIHIFTGAVRTSLNNLNVSLCVCVFFCCKRLNLLQVWNDYFILCAFLQCQLTQHNGYVCCRQRVMAESMRNF